MCGIVGVAGDINNKEKDIFKDLLIFSQVRGPHSTGVGAVSRHGKDFELVRVLGRPGDLIDVDKRWDKAVHTGNKFILGHNRFATVGKISVHTAHPYEFDNILGCHNGTIPEFRLKQLKDNYHQYGTDSQAVLANIDKFGVEQVVPQLTGAWAFVWYDRRNGTLNFLRNDQRTLYYTYSANRRTIYWASEKGMLELALIRNDQEYGDIYDVTENKHISWVIPQSWNHEFLKPMKKEIKGWEYKPEHNQGNGGSGNGSGGGNGGVRFPGATGVHGPAGSGQGPVSNQLQRGAKVIDLTKDGRWKNLGPYTPVEIKDGKVVPVPDFTHHKQIQGFDGQGYLTKGRVKNKHFFRGYRGEELNEKEFEALTKQGCAWCDAITPWGQPVRFVSKTEHICMTCNNDDGVKQSVGLR